MEKLNLRGQKNSNEKLNDLIEENESLKAIVSDYSELKKFAEEVVEKHNALVSEYKGKQSELTEARESTRQAERRLKQKDNEIQKQKEIIENLDQKLVDFQNHINNLIDRFKEVEKDNKRLQTTIESLEKYIEVMDSSQKAVKNERGAGRKKKYSQEQIDLVVDLRTKGHDYDNIKEQMIQEFTSKDWEIKEIKYIYSRYK